MDEFDEKSVPVQFDDEDEDDKGHVAYELKVSLLTNILLFLCCLF